MPEKGSMFEQEKRRSKVKRQITLPWSKAFEISMKSLKTRFMRSLITMSGIVLAIAFLMSIWTSNAMIDSFRGVERADANYNAMQTMLMRHKVDLTGESGLQAKDIWLIVLSLLVCVVGIVNAMLMSVTERIHEIGTMKCLGALNAFIVRLFLLESSLQGIAGTVIGIALGFILSFAGAIIGYGGLAFSYFPFVNIAAFGLLALAIGSLLSVFAAIFPAYRAASMQPVDALRKEE